MASVRTQIEEGLKARRLPASEAQVTLLVHRVAREMSNDKPISATIKEVLDSVAIYPYRRAATQEALAGLQLAYALTLTQDLIYQGPVYGTDGSLLGTMRA